METFLQIFFSAIFIFGLYCAALEIRSLVKKLWRNFKRRRQIDKEGKKD